MSDYISEMDSKLSVIYDDSVEDTYAYHPEMPEETVEAETSFMDTVRGIGESWYAGAERGAARNVLETQLAEQAYVDSYEYTTDKILSPQQVKEQFGLEIDAPMNEQKAMMLGMLKDEKAAIDQRVEGLAEKSYLNAGAAFVGEIMTSVGPLDLAAGAALSAIASPLAGGAYVMARRGKSLALAARSLGRYGKLLKAARKGIKGTTAAQVIKAQRLQKVAGVMRGGVSGFLAQGSINGAANALNELAIHKIEEDKGYRYDLEQVLPMAFFAPFALSAMGKAIGVGVESVSKKVSDMARTKAIKATRLRLSEIRKRANLNILKPIIDVNSPLTAKQSYHILSSADKADDIAKFIDTKIADDTPDFDFHTREGKSKYASGLRKTIGEHVANGEPIPKGVKEALDEVEAFIRLEDEFGPQVNDYMIAELQDAIQAGYKTNYKELHPWLKSEAEVEARIKQLREEGKIQADKEDFSAEDVEAMFEVDEARLAKYMDEQKVEEPRLHKRNDEITDAKVDSEPTKVENTYKEMASGDAGEVGKTFADTRERFKKTLKDYQNCLLGVTDGGE